MELRSRPARYRSGVASPDNTTSAVTDWMAERAGRSLVDRGAPVGSSGGDPLDRDAVRRRLREVHGVEQNERVTPA